MHTPVEEEERNLTITFLGMKVIHGEGHIGFGDTCPNLLGDGQEWLAGKQVIS